MTFNLSEKAMEGTIHSIHKEIFIKEDIKEFIKLLKEELTDKKTGLALTDLKEIIIKNIVDKLAGDKLT